jgi:methionyl-tRNA formyltransferase
MRRETGEIDWSQSAWTIHNLIRGTYPWPGAWTWYGQKRLKVHRARVCHDPELEAAARGVQPGTICACGAEGIQVACGEGVLDLLEIQSENGRRMLCRDCAHNYRFGQRMGGETNA